MLDTKFSHGLVARLKTVMEAYPVALVSYVILTASFCFFLQAKEIKLGINTKC